MVTAAFLLLALMPGWGQQLRSYRSGGIDLYYEEYGKGPALYILSGGPGEYPGRPYRLIIDSLKRYFTCVLIHQRGAGKSRNIPINPETISIAKYTRDIELLRKHRGDTKVTLLGYSWGGLLAMNYAAHHPAAVSNMILIGSAPPSYKLWHVLYDNQHARRSASELDSMMMMQKVFSTKTERELDSLKRVAPHTREVEAYRQFIALHIRAMYYDRSRIDRRQVDELFYEFNFQPISIIDNEVVSARWDITDQLRKLNIPVLIVYGRQDDQGESTFHLQQECLKNNKTVVIERCGHLVLDEQPQEFFRILMAYVKAKR